MVTVPLGLGAYERLYAGEPIIKLENRFMEQSPTNLREHTALVARPGTNQIQDLAGGTIRGNFTKPGLFSGDLFVVSGPNLWRVGAAGTPNAGVATQIQGIINNNGAVSVTWQKGIGYERMFIADGLLLQYYDGGSQATGTLSLSGGSITNQVIQIGGVYYSWNAAVDTNAPDGSAAHPWLANPGTDPLVAMANLLNFNGTRGVDFSTALGGPSTLVTASATDPSATGTLSVTGTLDNTQVFQIGNTYYSWNTNVNANAPNGSAANPWLALEGATTQASLDNMVKLINYTGTPGVDFSSALAGPSAYVTVTDDATDLFATALEPGAGGNSIATTVYAGANIAWGAATLQGGGNVTNSMLVTAISEFADGNTISTTVYSGAFLSWSNPTLTGGGIQALKGVPVPDGVGIVALANVSSYVLAAVSNSQKFFWINPGEVVIDPLNFAEKESNPDNITEMITVGDQVIILGQASTENWYATGDFAAPFAPIEGRVYMRGAIPGTPVLVKDSVILVGDDGVVYEIGYSFGTTAQWGVHRISNHGIEERIRTQLRAEQGLTP